MHSQNLEKPALTELCQNSAWTYVKSMLKKKVKTVALWKKFLSSIWVFTRQRIGLSILAKYRDQTVEIFSQTHKVDISLYFHSSVFWITSDFSIHLMHFTSELQTPISSCLRTKTSSVGMHFLRTYRIFWY